jgi:Neuraminidase (sialidase)
MKRTTLVVSALLTAGVCLADEAPKRVQDVTHGVVCSLPNDPFGYFGWPSIASQSDGTICVVASGLRQGHVCPWGRTTICKSKDYGKTWSYPLVINNTPMDDRDAGIVSLGGKRLAVTWFTSNSRYLFRGNRNEDGTWKNPKLGQVLDQWTAEDIAKYSASWIRVSEDGEYWGEMRKAPINSPHGFIVLKDKSWLYFGKEWKFFGEGLDMYISDNTPICAARSTDEGRTWEMLGAVPLHEGVNNNQCHEAHVVELPNGDLLGAIRVEGPFRVCLSRSSDGGKTWSTLEETGCMGSPPHLLRHSSGAIVCAYGYRKEPFGERCMISYDNGKTWEKDIVIFNDAPNPDLGYPASCELPDGSIITVYYQKPDAQSRCSILYSKWQLPDRE